MDTAPVVPVPAMSSDGDTGALRFPCSSSQQRCWFVDALDPGSAALNVALRWELAGKVDEDIVERAFNAIIQRHEVLRTRFLEVDGEPTQEVMPELSLRLSVIDLRHFPEEARDDEARRLAAHESHVPFDISQLPLVRITLLRLTADYAVLLITVHQIVFDGWSIHVLGQEFSEIATAYQEGRTYLLPELPLQYGDYARWQKEYLEVEAPRHASYWHEQLVHAPYMEVQGDFEKPARATHRGVILAEMLPPATGERMEATAQRLGVTPFVFGFAATVAILKRITGQTDITIGTQIAGRDDSDLEGLIGVFINNLVLRVDTRHAHSFADLLTRAKETVRDALIHQAMPFHRLVGLLNPPRDAARTPLISVNFTMLKEVVETRQCGQFRLYGLPSMTAGSLYDLNFFVVKWPDGWRMAMEYNPDIFAADTAAAFMSLWRGAFESAVEDPEFALSTLVPPPRSTSPAIPVPAPDGSIGEAAQVSDELAADTATEATLASIWKDILAVETLSPESNFFELGGHSLLAIRMLARIRDEFGVKIDPISLFEAPTLRQLAKHLHVAKPIEAWNIVTIQPDGNDIPIIAINNTLAYYNVARAIGPDHPFLGVQLFDPNTPRVLEERSLEDIARDYVKIIRAARPNGPYVLFGLCVAGAIAYEAACQLEQAGECVPLVILADTWRPGYLAGLPADKRSMFLRAYRWHVIKHHYARIVARQTTVADVLATYPSIQRTGIFRAAIRLGLIADRPYGQQDWSTRWFLPMLERARNAYKPRSFEGRVVLLRSDEIVTAGLGDDLGWSTVLQGSIDSFSVPGWHADMFQNEGARLIAQHLRPLLASYPAGAPDVSKLAAE